MQAEPAESNQESDRASCRTLIALLAVLPLFLRWQGVDVTDLGYSASNAQQFFAHPENLQGPGQLYWLTNLVAAITNGIFTFLGVPLLGLKLGYALCLYPLLYVAYRLISTYASSSATLSGLLLSLLLVAGSAVGGWLHYNVLTALMFICTAYALHIGLSRGQLPYIIVAGFIAGLSTFARLPNLLSVAFVFVALYSGVIREQGLRETSTRTSLFVGGYLLSFVVAVILMISIGHFDSYVDSLKWATQPAPITDKIDHSFGRLLTTLLGDQFQALVYAICGALGILTVSALVDRLPFKGLKWVSVLVASVACTLFLLDGRMILLKLLGTGLATRDFFQFVIPGAITVSLLMVVGNAFRSRPDERTLACLGLVFLHLVPLGSGNGIRNATNGIWIGLPYLIAKVLDSRSDVKRVVRLGRQELRLATGIATKITITTLAMLTAFILWKGTYRDSPNRLAMVHGIDHPMARGMLTTQQRAQVLEEVLEHLAATHSSPYLLALNTPLLCYLTEKQPYLYHTWPGLLTPAQLKSGLENALASRPELPVYVAPKGSVNYRYWPEIGPYLDKTKRAMEIVNEFLESHEYRKEFENDFFEVWRSTKVNLSREQG